MTTAAIIVAAGRGIRAGGDTPKQWQSLAGRRVIDHTLAAFTAHPAIAQIVVVLHPDDLDADLPPVTRATGGTTRAASVRAGLDALAPDTIRVLIHDAARPLVSEALIDRVLAALDRHPGAAPALPVTDALWHGDGARVTALQDRSGLYRAQTPQGFHLDTLRAARLLETRPMDIRLGNGFDVHRFGPGDHVTLCGVSIPHTRGLQGHSDADVGMHALTDAIYGALGQGDIGQHFPPSDPQWKGAASHIFLDHAVRLAAEHGFTLSNMDCTLICEHPKIGPHAAEMKAELARITGVDPDRISVKAATSEQLGFTGRGEGIAALATATLVRP